MKRRRNAGQAAPVRVGHLQQGGQVLASRGSNERGDRVLVTVAALTGLQVNVSLPDAAELYHGLGRILGIE